MKKIYYFFFLVNTIYTILPLLECDHLPPPGISPLFSFGHTILPKKTFAISEEVFYIKQKPFSGILALTFGYYGVTDSLSLIFSLPFYSQKPRIKGGKTGIGDFNFTFNYLLYKDESQEHRYRAMAFVGMRLPTTTTAKGTTLYTLGTNSFFLGITQDALTSQWYSYSDFGALLTTKFGQTKFGNTLLFNVGLGKIFCIGESYLTFFLELSDFYSWPDRIKGKLDLTTGGNLLFFGPSIRYEYKNFLFQSGIQADVARNVRSELESNIPYILGFFAAYTF